MKAYPKINNIRSGVGFTLVELLVGMVLSLFIIGVSITYLVTSSQTFGSQTNDSVIQENARFGLEIMTQQLRLAGLNPRNDLNDSLDVILTSSFCEADEGGVDDSGPSGSNGACTRDGVAGADNSSDRFGIDFKIITPTTTCDGADVTQAMLNAQGGSLTLASTFWSADIDGDGIRSLYCQTIVKSTRVPLGPAVPLIDGIDAMQVQYGLDADSDGVVERYVNFTDLAATNPGNPSGATRNVKLVRLAMLINSGLGDVDAANPTGPTSSDGERAEDKTYTLLDGPAIQMNQDTKLRQIFSTTILIPNTLGTPADT